MNKSSYLSPIGTQARTILDYLLECGPCTKAQVCSDLEPEIASRKIMATMFTLCSDGRLVTDGASIDLSYSIRMKMESEIAKKRKANLVPPRVVKVLRSPELSPRLYLNTKGTREDSDWSQFKSRQI